MGEARRRRDKQRFTQGKKNPQKRKEASPKIFDWLPVTEEQEKSFIQTTIKGAWLGIGLLVFLWIVVRFIGPALGWWVPADLK